MYRLQVRSYFDAAHYIKDYKGKCSRMHGHRWGVEVVLEGKRLNEMNILLDFSWVKEQLEGLTDRLDHRVLNEVLEEENVTAEFLAKWFYGGFLAQLGVPLPRDVKLARVTVWESLDCCVKYYRED